MFAGFTLVELVVSLALMSIVLTALGSVVAFALKSAPSARLLAETQWQITLDTITNDLRDAVKITTAGSRAVEIEVPDRDSDGANETIRYEWSGFANTPILRTYKGNGGYTICGGVTSFSLSYLTSTRPRIAATAASEGAEQLLAAYATVGAGAALVRTNSFPAQVFTPTLPANATSWRFTKLRFVARNGSGLLGTIGVQLRPVDSSTGMPNATVLDEQGILQTLLTSSNTWYTLNYNVPGLTPGVAYAIVLRSTLGSSPMTLPVTLNGVPDNGGLFTSYSTSTLVWAPIWDGSLAYEIYGKVTAPGTTTNSITVNESIKVSLTPTGGRPFTATVSLPMGGEQ